MWTRLFSLVAFSFLLRRYGHCYSTIDQPPVTAMVKEGDLNIGAIIHFYAYSLNPLCANFTQHPVLHQLIHVMVHEIEKINKNNSILPNVTLGYVILDDCTRVIPAVPRALQLMPVRRPHDNYSMLTYGEQYDVIGIIGPYNSEPNLVVASMAGYFQMPQIGPYASSDALSDKTRFPYFFRTITPDRHMLKATIEFAKKMGWEYISVIYSDDEFGYNTDRFVRNYAAKEGLCVEESYPVDTYYQRFDYAGLIETISGPEKKSKVYIVNLINSQAFNLLGTMARLVRSVEFVMIFSQCMDLDVLPPYFYPMMQGFIQLRYGYSDMKEFYDYYKNDVTPWKRRDDPWVTTLWEQYYGCRFNPSKNGKQKSCDEFTNIFDFPQAQGQPKNILGSNIMGMADAVNLFAKALETLINERCPGALGNKGLLRKCVTAALLRQYLSETELESDSTGGYLKFDENFDAVRDYEFIQLQKDTKSRYSFINIAEYNPLFDTDHIILSANKAQWPAAAKLTTEGRLESVCSHPCTTREIYIQGDVQCCWTCHVCRENEIVSRNSSICLECPVLTWPNEETYLECISIKPSFLTWSHIYGIGMTGLSILGIIASTVIIFLLIKHRNRVVIRGSSKELMAVIILGAFLAYITIPTFIIMPTMISCIASRTGFSISCTLLFAPLLVKSIRIYRIFRYSARFEQDMILVNTSSQMVIVGILTLIQVVLSLATGIVWIPYAELSMPIKTEKYVELQCDLNMYGIIIPLGYNIFLAFLCAICGFITRKLPDNFNESWYIFVSICTTLFIWTAFLPTYFAAFYAFHKAVLLAFALFLNSTITVLCLFGPKIYAVYFTDDNEIQVSNFKGRTNQTYESKTTSSNTVSTTKSIE